ncbi:transglycosylase domain-containing protein [Actinomyces minihominis]|uniref:transglycosylase domain-containing protein n=1 Tax=Actinomyces minihominis TaxID=2002838 RepID=UPI000C06B722|nr:transglycosylase domain-containing protein [Actinomyces minihominis]
MASSPKPRTSRRLNPAQFIAIIVAIALTSTLLGALIAGLALPVAGAAGAITKAVPATFEELPSDMEVIEPAEESRMLNADGGVMARFYAERRTVVTSEQIAPIMKQAMVAIEDRRFYTHHGIDPDGMARAFINNLTSGNTQGASTITQQYVKNMLLEKGLQAGDQDMIDDATEVSAERKLREARYAISLESALSKDEILTGYLNLATFGTNLYGVEAAARTYFSKSAADLNIAEAALLAGTVQQPGLYDPLINPEQSLTRRNIVLGEMLEEGYITEAEYDEAYALTIEDMLNPNITVAGCAGAGSAAYYCRFAVETFLNDPTFGEDRAEREHLLNTGGLTLRTSLDRDAQKAAYSTVTGRVAVNDPSGLNVALSSVVPQNGHIVAMAQNTNYGIGTESDPSATEISFNADPAHGGGLGFQTGSTFKVFTLVEWFYESKSAYQVVGGKGNSFPTGSFKCGGQPIYTETWTPGESNQGKAGAYSVIDATRFSVNQAFADMATQVDFCQIFERAKAMGITDSEGNAVLPVPGNLIGSSEATPLDLTAAFGSLAATGSLCTPMALLEVEDRDGRILKTYSPDCANVIDPTVAKQVTNVLYKAYANETFQIGRPFAGKSGTTDGNSNVWFVGYTPQLATGIWAGVANNPNRPGQNLVVNGEYIDYLYGGPFLGQAWANYMMAALEGKEVLGFEDVFIGNKPLPPKVETPKTETKPNTQADSGNSGNNSNNSGNTGNAGNVGSENNDD